MPSNREITLAEVAVVATVDIQALSAEYRRLLDLAQERFQVEILLLDQLKGGRTGDQTRQVSQT
jgi:hypothetical protein